MSSYQPAVSDLETGVHGITLDNVGPGTATVASKPMPQGNLRPLVTPLYLSSTYLLDFHDPGPGLPLEFTSYRGGVSYSRLRNPTREAAEATINALERGAATLLFSSGSAATSTALLTFLKPGDHVIAPKRFYGGTHAFIKDYMEPNLNVQVTFITDQGIENYRKEIRPNTRVLFGESPSNPLMDILDLQAFGKLGREHNCITMVDSTFGSPYLQQPCMLGVDLSIHSCTKYMGGHSDLIGGAITARTLEHWNELKDKQIAFGNMLSPFDSVLLLRGLRTLHVRMDRHSSNAQELAEFLEAHPNVARVHYPGLKSHAYHEVAKKQMKAFSGMLAFEVKGGIEGVKTILKNVKIINVAVSLGGVESLIESPATLTHSGLSEQEKKDGGIIESLLRFSIGIEDVADLKSDLKQALDKIVFEK